LQMKWCVFIFLFPFFAVGAWYKNFDQVSDEEAVAILHRNWSQWSQAA